MNAMYPKKQEKSAAGGIHLVTTEEMETFKTQLLDEMKKRLREASGNPGKRWLKSFEVRKQLGISPGTLQNLRINGTLPFSKIGGVLFYDYEDVQKMIVSNKTVHA